MLSLKNPGSNKEFQMISTSLVDLKNIGEKKKRKEKVRELFQVAKSRGLSAKELDNIVDFLTTEHTDEKLFQHLILCMIPNDVVPSDVVKKVIMWILKKHEDEDCEKTDNLLSWVTSLLDYHMVDENTVHDYYPLLWCYLHICPKAISHLMYVVTKPEDVIFWRISRIQTLIMQIGPKPYLCALLKRFKELNSQFAYVIVPPYKTGREFHVKDEFYTTLRANLKDRHLSGTVSISSIVVPSQQRKTSKINNGLLPHIQYLQLDKKFDETFILDIKNGVRFAKCFRKITLPSNTLSLLNNITGIYVLMYTNKCIQEQFLQNLYAVLERSLMFKKTASSQEIEDLLDNVIRLHCTFQQGFITISHVLKRYLQTWDGVQFKKQVYSLVEWFVFESSIEINRFLVHPLYALFIRRNSAEEMCEIICCLTNLLTNTYLAIGKDDGNDHCFFKENVLSSRDELIPVVKSLTKFTCTLLKHGLRRYPCNNQILFTSISFYEKINYLERLYDMPFWTIISSNVMYHSLFSINALLLDHIGNIYKSYNSVSKLPIAKSTEKMKEKVIRLQSYAEDIYNCLWSSRAFVDRNSGHVFRGLSLEDEAEWKNFVNLNNAFSLERHVMFAPYRMMHSAENAESSQFLSKANVLNIMKSPTPHLVELITQMIDEKLDRHEDEFD